MIVWNVSKNRMTNVILFMGGRCVKDWLIKILFL